MWEVIICYNGSDMYKEYQSLGWEPFHFVLIPDPNPVIASGKLNMLEVIGLRKWIPQPDIPEQVPEWEPKGLPYRAHGVEFRQSPEPTEFVDPGITGPQGDKNLRGPKG